VREENEEKKKEQRARARLFLIDFEYELQEVQLSHVSRVSRSCFFFFAEARH
jgi:hypothetical protein